MQKCDRVLKIANIIEESRVGGPQTRNLMIASVLKKKFDFTFIFPKENCKEYQTKCNSLGIKSLPISLTTIKRDLANIISYLILFPFEVIKLSRILKKNCFDILHISGGSWQFKGLLAAKLANIRVIWELNDTYAPFLIRLIFFFLSRLADGFIFASKRTKKYYEKLAPINCKNFLIQSPVDTNSFNPSNKYLVEKFIVKNRKEKKFFIGTVANISPVKGILNLLKTANKLKLYSNKIVFIVIGAIHKSQMNYHAYLIQMMKKLKIKNFFFLKSRKDVRPLLKAMDIYVCSSSNESSPLSVWEAMSMKKAIVSTDVGDVKNFIKNNINGFIVKTDDPNDLANAIRKLIENPKLRSIFGKSAREVVKNKLNLKICASLHEQAYKSIVMDDKY